MSSVRYRGRIQREHGVWDPMLELTQTILESTSKSALHTPNIINYKGKAVVGAGLCYWLCTYVSAHCLLILIIGRLRVRGGGGLRAVKAADSIK
jgi:hypothetical protein